MAVKTICPECGATLSIQWARLDEEIWVRVNRCEYAPCGYYEDVPADVEARLENRPLLPGL